MRIIALEEHFVSKGFIEVLQQNSGNSQVPPTVTEKRLAQLADLGALRLEGMDAGGIGLQVISDVGPVLAPHSGKEDVKLAQESNDQLAAAVAAHPDRFAGFAILPMTEPETAAGELERAIRELGLKGAMIYGTTNGNFLDDPIFLPILERASDLSVPIYLHPSLPPTHVREAYYTGLDPAVSMMLSAAAWGWHSEIGIHALRLILAGVCERFTNLQLIIGHMGEMIPFMLARINDQFTPFAEQLPRPIQEYFLRNFSITTSGFFTEPPLLLAMQVMGSDHILFSVDYPFSTNEEGRAFLEHASLSPTDKEKISYLNAERLLGLKRS